MDGDVLNHTKGKLNLNKFILFSSFQNSEEGKPVDKYLLAIFIKILLIK